MKKTFFHLKAFLCHGIFSIVICLSLTLLIVQLWYPNPWYKVLGGLDLLAKILLFDIIVGPLCVGLVYKTHKGLREKITDVSTITIVQLCFLAYGFHVVSISRPVFIVFNKDRFDVVVASSMEEEQLKDAKPPFHKVSYTGPVYAGIKKSENPEEEREMRQQVIISGIDYQFFPKLYQNIENFLPAMQEKFKKISDINFMSEEDRQFFIKQLKKHNITEDQLLWLPVNHRFGFMTAVMDKDDPMPLFYIDFDPYGGD